MRASPKGPNRQSPIASVEAELGAFCVQNKQGLRIHGYGLVLLHCAAAPRCIRSSGSRLSGAQEGYEYIRNPAGPIEGLTVRCR